ncbi:SgcJ/EcaC family oxidoreductase [Elizabethkingia sp. HX XZB]|uniref:YybH family protein n=1 Tax=Elizabethkingia sp. HX XZB TaxID=3003193 RepID=UPI002A24D6B9|nr:SgcJ/EcaC family oxidoreductase [Elizabethkingia sp. HX XZB]MDX8568334.1 SgcJ/EcaC family oxidoreductase [Elizabethkingia sp. HX XZB]
MRILVMVILLLSAQSCQNKTEMQSTNQNQIKMENSAEKASIENVLYTYGDALNTADVSKVLQVYTQDGVFMPTTLPTATGTEQLKESYSNIFKTIRLNVKFNIEEVLVNGDVAFARTSSKGNVIINTTDQSMPEENREFFLLKKENGEWKISRYMFNKSE